MHNLSIWFLSYCPFCRILPATSCTELNWPASLMKKKEKHTFFSTSMKLKSKQKIAIIFKSKWNNENVKNFLNVKKKEFFTYGITTDHMLKSNNLTPVYSLLILWLRVNFSSTDKYLFKDQDLLKVSESGSEAAFKEAVSCT